MTFATRPESAESDIFVRNYLSSFADVMAMFPCGSVVAANEILLGAYTSGRQVFVAGNGGSAALASHVACDLEKTVTGASPRSVAKRFRVRSLADNVATLTAWANDESFADVFAEQLRSCARARDVLLVISASGNSPNIVSALRVAKTMGVTSIGWLGFQGGVAMDLCDVPVHVPSDDYGLVESAHGLLAHLTTGWLRQATARWRREEGDHPEEDVIR